MVQIHVEVKVLDGKAPLLFAWWNKEEWSVDTCLVTCPCQGYGLVDGEQQETSSSTPGELAQSVGGLTKAFESSRVVSMLEGDLAPDISSLIDDCRDRRTGRGTGRRKKKGHRAKGTEEECGSNGTEAAKQSRESFLGGIMEDGTMVPADIFMEAVQALQNSIPSSSGMGGTHSSLDEEPKNSVTLPPQSNNSEILSLIGNASVSTSCIPVDEQHQGTTLADPVDISGEDRSPFLDDGEIPTEVPAAIEGYVRSPLHQMISHVPDERGNEGDTAGEMELDTSAPLGGPEEAPLGLKEDSGADADRGGRGKPESGASGPKRKNKFVLCELCGKTLTSKSIRKHMAIIHAEGERTTYCCDQCPTTFYHEPNLRRHIRRDHEGIRHKCRYCDRSFGQDWNRRVHENVHFPADQPIFVYKSRLSRQNESRPLRKNVYSKATNRTIDCEVCGKTMKSTSKSAHMMTHSKETFTCEICGVTHKLKNRYAHMRRHTHEKTEHCPHCTMAFYNKTALRLHLRTHTKERPLRCRYCDATFSRAGTRIDHERLHTGERPYQCELCEKAWRDRPTYVQHMKKHHPGRPLIYLGNRAPPTKTLDPITPPTTTLDPITPPATTLDPLATVMESIRQEIASVEQVNLD